MSTSGASTGTQSAPRPPSAESAGNRAGPWLLLIAASAAGPMAGIEIVLLGKPLGGATGLPGAVVGYVALTAVVLACLTVLPAWRWRLTATGRRAGLAVVGAAAGLLAAAAVSGVALFTCGVLITGALAGPLLVAARAVSGGRAFPLVTSAGAIAGAVLAAVSGERPGAPLLATAGVAGIAGIALAVVDSNLTGGYEGTIHACAARTRWSWTTCGALGFAVGATVLPALHLLLFRWNVLDSGQPGYLAPALASALVVAAVGGRRGSAPAPLLILAAGGPVLVATAPGPWQTVAGVAVTVAAATRATAVADALVRKQVPDAHRQLSTALTALVTAAGALGGLGFATGCGHLWGTGSALTLSSIPVLAAALAARFISEGDLR